MAEKHRRFKMFETETGEIEATLGDEGNEDFCRMRFAPSGKGNFRTIDREGDENVCRVLLKRVKGAFKNDNG